MPHKQVGQAIRGVRNFISAGGTLKQKNRKIREEWVAEKSLRRAAAARATPAGQIRAAIRNEWVAEKSLRRAAAARAPGRRPK